MEKIVDFKHNMAAHCETGTLTGLLNNAGLAITEPLVFGIGQGILFGYFESKNFPFPTFIVRSKPGDVREIIIKQLDIKLAKFSTKDKNVGMAKLDQLLSENKAVGTQVDFFYCDYLPDWMRVHINVHFINVIGKQDGKYVISDSYFPKVAQLDENMLIKGRWAGGHMAPNGFMYYPEKINIDVDLNKPIITGIKKSCRNMLNIPMPFIGVKGIYKFADKINNWSKMTRDVEHLSHEIMKINVLLEDQGTGGAGFRFMFATFLKQASDIVNNPTLNEMSQRIMKIGDDWRQISYFAAKIGKNRDLGTDRIKELSEMIRKQGDAEKLFFTDLKKVYK